MTAIDAHVSTDAALGPAQPTPRRLPSLQRVRSPRSRRVTRLLLLAGLLGLAGAGCTSGGANPSAAPQSPAPSAAAPAPTKAPAAFQTTPAPAITVAACRPGDVTGRLLGFGPAMGIMYIAVGIAPTHGSCSLPAAPEAAAIDGAGSRIAVGAAPDVAPGSRVAVPSQGLGYRIAVDSWCEPTRLQALELVLDPAADLTVRVALPADFAVACSGSATRVTMGGPVEP